MVAFVTAALPIATVTLSYERQKADDPGGNILCGNAANARNDQGCRPSNHVLPTRQVVPSPRPGPEPPVGPPPTFSVNVLEAEEIQRRKGLSVASATDGGNTLPGIQGKRSPLANQWAAAASPVEPAVDILR